MMGACRQGLVLTFRLANAIHPIPRARRTHWFHTIMVTRAELDRVFNNTAMKKRSVVPRSFPSSWWGALYADMCRIVLLCRTHRFAILAMSLSSLFDISHPTDFLRSALNMLTEYEQAKEDNDRPKMV